MSPKPKASIVLGCRSQGTPKNVPLWDEGLIVSFWTLKSFSQFSVSARSSTNSSPTFNLFNITPLFQAQNKNCCESSSVLSAFIANSDNSNKFRKILLFSLPQNATSILDMSGRPNHSLKMLNTTDLDNTDNILLF